MSISSNMNTFLEPWQNIGNSIAFILQAIYYTSTLYFITMTTESAFLELKNLVIPLQQRMIQEKDSVEQMKIKLLITDWESWECENIEWWWIFWDQQRNTDKYCWHQYYIPHHSTTVQNCLIWNTIRQFPTYNGLK